MTPTACGRRPPVDDAYPGKEAEEAEEAEEEHTLNPVYAYVAKITTPEVAEERTECNGLIRGPSSSG